MPAHHTTRRLVVAVAAVLSGTLAVSGPAQAACATTIARNDDGSAESSVDLDFSDDYAGKTFYSPSTGVFTTGMYVVFSGTPYGGCSTYWMEVNGINDHQFNACTPGWRQQQITLPLAATSVSISLFDVDGTSTTGVHFDVDRDGDDYEGHSYMLQDNVYVPGRLMWWVGALCT